MMRKNWVYGPEDLITLKNEEIAAMIRDTPECRDDLLADMIYDNRYQRAARWGWLAWGVLLGFSGGVCFCAVTEWVSH